MNDPLTGMPEGSPGFYRHVLGQSAVAMLATDEQLNIVCWNAAASALLEREAEGVIGRSIYDLVPESRHKLLGKVLNRVLRGECARFDIHADAQSAGGERRDLVLLLSPIAPPDASPEGVAAWILDETRRTRLAAQLAQAEKMASLGTLAGGVAHHFNNILGGVATFVDYALTTGDEGDMKRALQMTAEAASRASRITQSLLSFAREDSHRTDLADLTEIVLTFSHLVEKPLAENGIDLKLELEPVPIIAVEANRMHQVLGNLLSNAEEAMPDGGTVTIGITSHNDEVQLDFTDTGTGIPPEHLSQVFEPFFTSKGLLAGGDRANPGLGLSIVHGIVTEMGGRVSVESAPGEGARFIIRFPCAGN